MNVNLGCDAMYFSRPVASSGSWKEIGEKANYFSNVLRMRFVMAQKTFLRARYSIQG